MTSANPFPEPAAVAESPLDADELFTALLESTGEWAVLIVNPAGVIELANQLTPALLGRGMSQLVGAPFFETVPLSYLDGGLIPLKERPTYRVLHNNYKQVQPFFCLYHNPKLDKPVPMAL